MGLAYSCGGGPATGDAPRTERGVAPVLESRADDDVIGYVTTDAYVFADGTRVPREQVESRFVRDTESGVAERETNVPLDGYAEAPGDVEGVGDEGFRPGEEADFTGTRGGRGLVDRYDDELQADVRCYEVTHSSDDGTVHCEGCCKGERCEQTCADLRGESLAAAKADQDSLNQPGPWPGSR